MTFWEGKRVLVTGGHGFFGSHLVERLHAAGAHTLTFRSDAVDLTVWGDTYQLVGETKPDLVFHLAARVGGIGANQADPAGMLHDNALMGLHVLDACLKHEIQKLVIAGTVCAYPKHTPVPFREDDLWNGYPEKTNAPYGIAKKMLLVAAQAYRQQYGLNTIMLFPTNLYGPRDNFDLDTSHVIPAMIRKLLEGKDTQQTPILWGDGSPTRDFLYVEDAVDAFLLAGASPSGELGMYPINLGTGIEVSMATLAEMVKEATGYEGRIIWDTSRPNGQPRRCLDTTRARERLGWSSTTRLEDGIAKTVAWYLAHQRSGVSPTLTA